TGRLVPAGDVDAMARALLEDFVQPTLARERGRRARLAAQRRFSLDAMVSAYTDLYDRLLPDAAARGALRHRFSSEADPRGVGGIWDSLGTPAIERDVLLRMNESQHHRGPDETGVHFAPGIALGHKRLSIIDLATGQQPLFNEDGSVVIVFNGEIYNFQE